MSFNIGDKIKQKYIHDRCIHNGMVATIRDIRNVNYYPKGDYSYTEKRQQALIEYENGDTCYVILHNNRNGITSPFEIV